jgi:hypothetical protein
MGGGRGSRGICDVEVLGGKGGARLLTILRGVHLGMQSLWLVVAARTEDEGCPGAEAKFRQKSVRDVLDVVQKLSEESIVASFPS